MPAPGPQGPLCMLEAQLYPLLADAAGQSTLYPLLSE